MRIQNVISQRKSNFNASNQLVHEWEDEIVKEIGAELFFPFPHIGQRKVEKMPLLRRFLYPSSVAFRFSMDFENNENKIFNRSNIVPCVVDFWATKHGAEASYKYFNRNPKVLISSREAYEFLCSIHCPLPIEHCGLSISDKYRITSNTHFEKRYDLVLMGKQNPVLMDYLKRYSAAHSDFEYVYRVLKSDGELSSSIKHTRFEYYTSRGECLGNISSREDYMKLMSQARCGMWSTPSVDRGNTGSNGYNQVTPRLLEYMVCGCHVIGRWKDNADTEWYRLNTIMTNTQTYDQFERQLDVYCHEPADMQVYETYLEDHYTSKRISQLNDMIKGM